MSTTAKLSATPTLAEIAAVQTANKFGAYNRAEPSRRLARLQRVYAQRLAQQDLLLLVFEEGAPELTLRGETYHVTLRGDLLDEISQPLLVALNKALTDLEREIVLAHQEVAQWAEDAVNDYTDKVDYVPHILALCQPTTPPLATLSYAPSPISHAQQAA